MTISWIFLIFFMMSRLVYSSLVRLSPGIWWRGFFFGLLIFCSGIKTIIYKTVFNIKWNYIPNIDLPIINPLVSVTDTLGIHIPHSIKLKIWNCEYVQLEKMLDNDNTQLENEHKLVIIGGQITFKPQKMIKQKLNSETWTVTKLFTSCTLSVVVYTPTYCLVHTQKPQFGINAVSFNARQWQHTTRKWTQIGYHWWANNIQAPKNDKTKIK
jgi:hypothetical protein